MASKTAIPRVEDLRHQLVLHCECGNHGMINLRHWERVRCVCGRIWWCLIPKRAQAAKLAQWPGTREHPIDVA